MISDACRENFFKPRAMTCDTQAEISARQYASNLRRIQVMEGVE